MVDSKSTYEYTPVGPRELRLIDLHRGSGTDLQLDIRHCAIDDDPPYEALSYCWGESTVTYQIGCNGQGILIKQGLHEALLQLRSTMNPNSDRRTIWADAICIDQSNLDERSEQVQLMGEIYHSAQRVVVWLGDADEDTCKEFDFAQTMLSDGMPMKPGLTADHVGEIFVKLLSRPWFTRTWVVQEVALAKEASLHYGRIVLTWDRLVELCTQLVSVVTMTYQGTILVSYLSNLERAKQMYQMGQKGIPVQPFRHLLACRERDAGDLRDKVYGLIGLFHFESRGEKFVIIPDYGEQNTKQAVYLDFAVKSLQSARVLDLLSIPRAPTNDGLPSWAPRWDLENPMLMKDLWQARVEVTKQVTAAGTFNYEPVFSPDHTKLKISGHIIDTIEEIGPVCLPPGQDEAIMSKVDSLASNLLITYQESMRITGANTPKRYYTGAFRPEEEHDMQADFTQIRKLGKLKSRLEQIGVNGVQALHGKRAFVGAFAFWAFGGLNKRENRDRFWRKGEFNKPGHDMRSVITNRRFIRTTLGFVGIVAEQAVILNFALKKLYYFPNTADHSFVACIANYFMDRYYIISRWLITLGAFLPLTKDEILHVESSDGSLCLYAGNLIDDPTDIGVLDYKTVVIYLKEKMEQDISSEFMRIMNIGQQDAKLHWIADRGDQRHTQRVAFMTVSMDGIIEKYVWWTICPVNMD
ncbi:heterokaryon incompatibility protein-domain-containing protein [Ampelomyces quisqualis]|uniref:Heterokaryon incompatibility protein-domain-containing protein n=1 Tax=Ampelomyces quisqualis TaxID=50730 RepID=A0A6A5QRM1_AMPQU|nr:heterokaryon incompatibility protein-domain-containing protein [Ampelomyces quisqualis]